MYAFLSMAIQSLLSNPITIFILTYINLTITINLDMEQKARIKYSLLFVEGLSFYETVLLTQRLSPLYCTKY